MKKVILTGVMVPCTIMLLTGCNLKLPFELDFWNQEEKKEVVETEVENEEIVNEDPAEEQWLLPDEYFTEIELQDGLKVVVNPENILALVNKEVNLPSTYKPQQLVTPNVTFSFGEEDVEKKLMRKEAAEALEKLFAEATKQNIHLFAVSGYRSYERQETVFNYYVNTGGKEYAESISAHPGQSEHQTGLAMDISSESVGYDLTEDFGESVEGKWVKENAHKSGFIIRYPKGKENITGYDYEPWHLRYVGVDIATVIYENNLTLEEYFNKVKKS